MLLHYTLYKNRIIEIQITELILVLKLKLKHMKKFNVNGKLGRFDITLPESLEEITNEYFISCTEFVHPAPEYSLVAVVYKDALSLVLSAAKKNTSANISVVPVFIKSGVTDSQFISSLSTGERVVVAGSDLAMGHHINSPYNKITPSNIVALCEGDRDIYAQALVLKTPVCFVEFKLLPNNAIHAKLDDTKNSFVNQFVNKTNSIGEA